MDTAHKALLRSNATKKFASAQRFRRTDDVLELLATLVRTWFSGAAARMIFSAPRTASLDNAPDA